MSDQPQSKSHASTKTSIYGLYKSAQDICRRPFLSTRPLQNFPLPLEIVYLIVEHFGPAELLALCLTCKPFFHLFFPNELQLSPEEKESFLLGLEKDTPNVYYCDHCVKLHPWRKSWASGSWPSSFQMHSSFGISVRGNPLWLSYGDARLVMNRHFYGPSYGLPLSRLSQSDVLAWDGFTVRSWTRGRIIDDRLYFCRKSRGWKVLFGSKKEFRKRYLPWTELGVCSHLHVKSQFYTTGTEGNIYIPCGQKGGMLEYAESGRCRKCPTEYEIKITRHFITGWHLSVTTYGLLGECRSVKDPVWVHMRDHFCWLYSFDDGEPSIKEKWLASVEEEKNEKEIRRRSLLR